MASKGFRRWAPLLSSDSENGPKYVSNVTYGARVAGHGQGGSYTYSPALRDWQAGCLSGYPACVFVFRGARMASKDLRVASEG
jgi:hypothetical protein